MRNYKRLRAATLAVIATGLLATACTVGDADPKMPKSALPFITDSDSMGQDGQCLIGDCGPAIHADLLGGGWTSIGDVPLPGGIVHLGPGSVSGVNPGVEQDGISAETLAQMVPVIVEGLRTPYDSTTPRAQAIAAGVYGGVNRPGIGQLFAPEIPQRFRYADDIARTSVKIDRIEKANDYPEVLITVSARLPVINEETGEAGILPLTRTVLVTGMDSWVLDWIVAAESPHEILPATP